MPEGLKPYPVYKNSGVPWLGSLPEGWACVRVRNIVDRSVRYPVGDGDHGAIKPEHYCDEGIPYIRVQNLGWGFDIQKKGLVYIAKDVHEANPKSCLRPGDILIGKTGSVGKTALVPSWMSEANTTSSVGKLTVDRSRASVRYYGYVMRASCIHDQIWAVAAQKTAQPGFDIEDLVAFSVPSPPLHEQAAIVRYLDHADRKVRHAIRACQQLIKLLMEQKQAIIQRAVTRGLDPNVRLKPSGVPWLGNVPEHWEIRRAKQVTRILRGKFTYRPRNDPSLYDGVYPFIQTGSISRVGKFITSYEQTLNERGLAVSKLFPAGTLVMTIAANIGDVAVLTFDACFPDSVVGFMPHKLMDRDYLYLVLVCMKPELLREAPVNTQGNLNVERISVMSLPCPPLPEQFAIVQYIDRATASLDKAIDAARREIDLLREYRMRLIADVVTGKLDVRDAAAHLPDEPEEQPEPIDEEPADDVPDLESEEAGNGEQGET